MSYRDLVRKRSFLPFWVGGALSFAGPSTVVVVLVWATAVAYPANLSGGASYSALALAILGLSATLPTLAGALLSGTLADRFDRRSLMALTNSTAVLATAALAAVLFAHPAGHVALPGPPGFYLPLWLVLACPLWALVSATATLFRPAFNSILPKLLPTAALGRANGLVYGVAVSASVAGSLGATALIMVAGQGWAMLVPLALFVGTAVAVLAMRPPVAPREAPTTRFATDVTEGYRFLYRNRALLQVTAASLLINFLTALAFVELGLYVRDWLGVTEAILLGAMTTGASVGSGIGTVFAGRVGFERRAGRYLIVLTACQGFTTLGLAFSHSIWLSIPIMVLFGIFPGMSATIFLATMQAIVPNRVLGRVLAADEVGSFGMVPIGQYAGGIVTLARGVQAAFLLAGAGTVAVAGGMAAFSGLRRLGYDPNRSPDEVRGPESGPPPVPLGEAALAHPDPAP
ncbi:MAG: MFS transporter [Thermoplasmata archaeon]|nr:MFS transporter [Thermoplasmata archaeon]MCI4359972.1 MFS transporter [Thermoplasmata archaeon]